MTWHRSPIATGVCRCDHYESEHRIDLKRMACNRGGCPCRDYDLVALAWSERRTVIEPLDTP